MFEHITYEDLLKRMLGTVLEKYPDIDTREGSPVWYGLAPAAVELMNIYVQLDAVLNETFADTASRIYLIRRAAERGITPYPATHAAARGEFTPESLELPPGARFSIGELNYAAVEKLSPGVYKMQCETPGEQGNEHTGTMIPIDYIPGLESARMTGLLIPGEDEESTESIRKRYFETLSVQSFGGNVADYKEAVNAIPGVGGVKVYRAWNIYTKPSDLVPPDMFWDWFSNIPGTTPLQILDWLGAVAKTAQEGLLTVGGTVRLVIIDSTLSKPTDTLVETVQNLIDPPESHAEGLGIAPIGHFVTVKGVEETFVEITSSITYLAGWVWDDVKPYAESAVDDYFTELRAVWADSEEPLVVRISQIETRLLSCPGVLDVTATTLNGQQKNLLLGEDYIPVRGDIIG